MARRASLKVEQAAATPGPVTIGDQGFKPSEPPSHKAGMGPFAPSELPPDISTRPPTANQGDGVAIVGRRVRMPVGHGVVLSAGAGGDGQKSEHTPCRSAKTRIGFGVSVGL